MRYPVDNFKTEWNTTAGYSFGAKTSYGYHDGVDINDNGGGNSDLGKSLFAIADGVVTSVHTHTGKPTFGKHLHIKIDGPWGTRWVHYAHCQDMFVSEGQMVKEGQRIATVGNSGTDWAHCHFAIKSRPTGIDGIATSLDTLSAWEDPIKFIETWFNSVIIPQPTITDQSKFDFGSEWGILEMQQVKSVLNDQMRTIQQKNDRIGELDNKVSKLEADLNSCLLDLKTVPIPLDSYSATDLLMTALRKLTGGK